MPIPDHHVLQTDGLQIDDHKSSALIASVVMTLSNVAYVESLYCVLLTICTTQCGCFVEAGSLCLHGKGNFLCCFVTWQPIFSAPDFKQSRRDDNVQICVIYYEIC